jgi:hypothetical protein
MDPMVGSLDSDLMIISTLAPGAKVTPWEIWEIERRSVPS